MYKPEPSKYTNMHNADFCYGITESIALEQSVPTLILFLFKIHLVFRLANEAKIFSPA